MKENLPHNTLCYTVLNQLTDGQICPKIVDFELPKTRPRHTLKLMLKVHGRVPVLGGPQKTTNFQLCQVRMRSGTCSTVKILIMRDKKSIQQLTIEFVLL